MEEWKAVPGYEGWYEASTHGQVRKIQHSIKSPMRLSQEVPFILAGLVYRKGYRKTHLCTCDGLHERHWRPFTHRLIWETFNGPIPDGLTVNHIDGDKANNRLDNLELATHQEQYDHAVEIGLKTQKLAKEDARTIREMYANGGWTFESLGQVFDVSVSFISQLVKRRPWSKLGDEWFD